MNFRPLRAKPLLLAATLPAAILLAATLPAMAQDDGYWKATSKTARSITGDIVLRGERLTMNFTGFTIAQIRTLEPAEINGVFNADASESGGNLYRLNIPGDKTFLHRNTLCGAEPTQYMATYRTGKDLQVAFFSGSAVPAMTAEALNTSTTLCGTYMYSH